MTPALGARTSMVTLSVSICAMTSSSATASPGALAMVPGAMVPALYLAVVNKGLPAGDEGNATDAQQSQGQSRACHPLHMPSAVPVCYNVPQSAKQPVPAMEPVVSGVGWAPSVIESPIDGTTAWTLSHSRLPVRMPRDLSGPGHDRAAVLG